MSSLRLMANMNISPDTVSQLRKQGWDIVRVSQILPVNASDQEILELARQENRVLVTQDLDFSSLLALGGFNQPSLITIRLTISDPETVTQRLLALLSEMEQMLEKGCAITVEDSAIRIRWLPIT